MEGEVWTLYHQAYTLAYDLAKKAEKAFRFERGLTTSNYIQYGYWDPAYDGLLAGERLYIGLKQLEAAYQEKRGYDFEIVKNISLQQLNPLELIALRETGQCNFAVPEVLFDMVSWPLYAPHQNGRFDFCLRCRTTDQRKLRTAAPRT